MGLNIAGHNIPDPMPIWRDYAHTFARTIHEYDLGGAGDPYRLTAEEVGRTRRINSRVSSSECDEVVARAAEAGSLWHDVPAVADLSLANPGEPNGLFEKATRLYWHFTWPEKIHGVRVAKIHKVLHIKRPALYPILDSNLKKLYREKAMSWVNELRPLDVTIDDSPPYWAAIRQDLVHNQRALHSYQQELAAYGDEAVALLGELSNLRLLDIVAWSIASES